MIELGTRVVQRAGPFLGGMNSRRPEASAGARPLWPFTVRDAGQRKPPQGKGPEAKPGMNFTT